MRYSLRRALIFGTFLTMIAGGLVVIYFSQVARGIPPEFDLARRQGALVAQDIVNLSQASIQSLQAVNILDRQGKFTTALASTTEIIQHNQEIRDKAIDLSRQVEVMTKSLSSISSFEARQAALEAISSRLAMISRLVNYSAYLSDLLDALRLRFAGLPRRGGRPVAVIIDEINGEVTAINNFDKQAQQAMARFDTIVTEEK